MTLTNSQRLARFAGDLRYGDLPPDVVAKAKELALHAWGVQLAASTLPWSKGVFRAIRDQGGTPESTVVNYGWRTSATNAAFVNGSFSHGFELDDNHERTGVKAGCVVIPTALAVGERTLASGTDVITGVVAAYEIMTRIGLMIAPSVWRQGGHPTGSGGGVGAAVITGRMLGLDNETLAYAIGGGAAVRSGLNEVPVAGRGHLKRSYGGMAAAHGIRAALLAREGISSPLTTLDHDSGLARTYEASPESVALLTAGLGQEWEIRNVYYKVYGQDGYIQPMSQALGVLRDRHGFTIEDVDSVRLGTSKLAVDVFIATIREPDNLTDAQFSANFSAALYIATGGAGFHEYTEDNLHDPAIRDLARRITVEVDDEIEAEHARTRERSAKVTVRLKDGSEHTETVWRLRDMTPEDHEAKFRSLAGLVLDDEQCDTFIATVRDLDRVRDMSRVARLLAPRA